MSVLGCYSVSVRSNHVSVEVEEDVGANINGTAVFRAKLGHVLMAAGYFPVLLVLYLKEFLLVPAKHVGNHTQL